MPDFSGVLALRHSSAVNYIDVQIRCNKVIMVRMIIIIIIIIIIIKDILKVA